MITVNELREVLRSIGFVEKNDIFIICTDGLTNMVSEEEICDTVIKNPEKAAEVLVKQANNFGGYDNITVVIIVS